MRYYNEAKTTRTIQQKARWFTIIIMFLLISGIYFATSSSTKDLIPEPIKEWFKKDQPEPSKKPTRKA